MQARDIKEKLEFQNIIIKMSTKNFGIFLEVQNEIKIKLYQKIYNKLKKKNS